MSGQDGARGYYFQAVLAALDSLNKEWESVSIEPNFSPDKIDIIWTDKNKSLIINQVKSSVNNFGKTEILDYLLDLYNCYNKAKEYKLSLIGNCTGPTKKFFNNISKHSQGDFGKKHSSLFKIKRNINVEIKPFDLVTLEGAIKSQVHKFLSSKGFNIGFPHIELISNGLVNQFSRFATKGQCQTKKQFEDSILGWVTFNYSNLLNSRENILELKFYLSEVLDFTDKLSSYSLPDISGLRWIEEKKSSALNIYENLKKRKLSHTHNSDIESSIYSLTNLPSFHPNKLVLPENTPFKISEERKSQIAGYANFVLNLTIDNSIFDFGDLKIPIVQVTMPFGSDATVVYGTEEEKSKYLLYEEFVKTIEPLCDLLSFWKKLQDYQFIPLILRNNGELFNEDIRILIYFPKNVEILIPEKFPIPTTLQNLNDLNETDSILFYLFHHQKDSQVNEYTNRSIFPNYYSPSAFIESEEQKLIRERNKFKNLLEYYFDYEIFTDNPDFTIISCEISQLNPHESISLPSFIFFKSDSEITINYEINSKQLSNKITDKLSIEK